jgi:hypothetical protein
MTPNELVSIIKSHRRDSLGYEDGDLSQQRAKAMDHYHGRPYGNEVEGRSQVVSRDLAETVDWAMPVLMRTFVQGGNVAEFDPVSEEDEPQAIQESDYMHTVLMKDNAGVMFIYDTLKEALLLKNCYGKHWWAEEDKVTREHVSGLTMDEVTKMVTDIEADGGEVEIVGQSRKFIPMPGLPMMPMFQEAVAQQENEEVPPPPGMLEVFDVRLKVKRKAKRVRVQAVPVEEVRVSKKCRGSLQESPFVEHVTRKTRSELIEMGLSREWVDALPAYNSDENSVEVNARNSVTDETDAFTSTSVNDRSMDEIEFCEAYIRVDYDSDGVAELRKVVTCADKIPPGEEWNEEIEACAITGGAIKRVPHRHVGESLDDELADLQEIMTTLKRQLNDNIYKTNNSEHAINDRVNLKDMMTSLPGGIKRVKGNEPVSGAIEPLPVRSIIGEVMPVLDFYNKSKEARSGIRPGSDMDPDILRETTKGAFLEHLNRASQKIELIARLYAETFLKEVVIQTHGLTVRHQDKARKVQLRGKWVEVNPLHWKERNDLTVKVGLGTGNEEEKRQKLGMLSQMQAQLLQAAVGAPPPVYEKMYSLFADMVEAMGFLPDKYAIAPGSDEYKQLQANAQQQPNPAMQVEQAKGQVTLQVEQMKSQAQGQAKAAELAQQSQLEQARMSMQAEVDRNRQQVEAQQQQAKMSMERELAMFKAQLQADLERERLQMQQQTAVLIARINAESKIDAAQLTAQTTLSAQQEQASDNAVGGV